MASGRLLLDEIVRQSAQAGYRQMIAVIGGGLENAASVRLHEGCGLSTPAC